MDMKLSSEQVMLQKAARQFLEDVCPPKTVRELEQSPSGFSREVWRQMGDLGWLGLPLPADYGGTAGSNVDLAVLNKELGRSLCPSPYLPTVVIASTLLAELGSEEQKRRYLPRIASGDLVLAFAFLEGNAPYDGRAVHMTARSNSGSFLLSGEKMFVEYGGPADELLVVARQPGTRGADGLSLLLVEARSPGVSCKRLVTLTRDRQDKVVFDQVKVPRERVLGQPGAAWPALERAINRGVVALCAQMVGAAERAHEIGVQYAKDRVQFGRPIGTFQAIQHYLAQTAIEITGADTLTYYCAWCLDESVPCREMLAKTKAFVGDTCRQAAFYTCQIYGGLGAIVDVDATLYLRRAKQWQLMMGGSGDYEDVVAEEILDR